MAFVKRSDALRETQAGVKTQEQWESLMQKNGLVVVDVHAAWCGPCKAIVNTFRKIKNEIGDDLLTFATAESDTIESLIDYRSRSQPTFLFYGDGQLVSAVRGCNGPLLTKSISTLLKKEHQILEGSAERDIFIDHEVNKISADGDNQKEKENKDDIDEEEEELVELPKEVTVVIIKPDAVKAGLADQIIDEITEAGLDILKKEERVLTKEEAAEFYKQHEGTDHFEQLIDFMSSGPCLTVVVSKPGEEIGESLIPEFRNLIGPTDVNTAKEEAPESLRAKYGTNSLKNALHTCDSSESAARELAFFYPDFNRPIVAAKKTKRRLQRTLALIRPNALARKKDEILKSIEDAGFLIAMEKEVQLTREQVEEFYPEHIEKDYFESLVANMTCGPSLALCIAREDAVETWRNLLGSKELKIDKNEEQIDGSQETEELDPQSSVISFREKFAEPEDEINPLHGASSVDQVEREMKLLFPVETTVAVIKPDAYENEDERDAILLKIKQAGFKISAQREVNLTKDLASMFYKEHQGKEFFDNLTDYMSSGISQFLILSREDAVNGFRTLMGPTIPEEAKEIDPNSLRAQFAKDTIKNAVHGSSSVSNAKAVIEEYFPDLKLDDNGLIMETETVTQTPAEVPAEQPAETKPAEVAAEAPAETKPAEVAAEAPAETKPAEVAAEAPAETKPAEVAAEAPAETKPAEVAAEAPAEVAAETPAEVAAEAPAETKPAEVATEAPAGEQPAETKPAEVAAEQPAVEDSVKTGEAPADNAEAAPAVETTELKDTTTEAPAAADAASEPAAAEVASPAESTEAPATEAATETPVETPAAEPVTEAAPAPEAAAEVTPAATEAAPEAEATPAEAETPVVAEEPAAASTDAPKEDAAAVAEAPEAVATEEPAAAATEEPAAVATEEPAAVATEEPAAVATEEPAAVATEEPAAVATEEPAAVATEEPAAVATEEPAAVVEASTPEVAPAAEVAEVKSEETPAETPAAPVTTADTTAPEAK